MATTGLQFATPLMTASSQDANKDIIWTMAPTLDLSATTTTCSPVTPGNTTTTGMRTTTGTTITTMTTTTTTITTTTGTSTRSATSSSAHGLTAGRTNCKVTSNAGKSFATPHAVTRSASCGTGTLIPSSGTLRTALNTKSLVLLSVWTVLMKLSLTSRNHSLTQ